MSIKAVVAVALVLFLVFIPTVDGIGLSPPQLRVTGANVGADVRAASIMLTNTDDKPAYLLIGIRCLEKSRPHKLRVVCNGCSREVGIQRGDLIYPAKIIQLKERETYVNKPGVILVFGVNATVEYKTGKTEDVFIPSMSNHSCNIGDYVLVNNNVQYTLIVPNTNISFIRHGNYVLKKIDTEEALSNKGHCPFCGSSNLVFYDFPPSDVLDSIYLACEKNPLNKTGARTYITTNKVEPNVGIEVDIYLNFSFGEVDDDILDIISMGATKPLIVDEVDEILDGRANASECVEYIEKYYGRHWEARITATSVGNVSQGGGASLVYGAESKFLIDTVPFQLREREEKKAGGYGGIMLVGIGVAGIFVFVAVGFVVSSRGRKKDVDIKFPESPDRKILAKPGKELKGRKLL